ncbi:MAG: hypothetical protein M3271_00270, partial [Actinomycetota bacterium]|nr:hypothetical protein [Actinomycetota bacterium]
ARLAEGVIEDASVIGLVIAVTGLVALGAAAYLWFATLLKVEEMEFVRRLLGRRFGRYSGAQSSSP